ncbi:hypothetical protein N8T08_007031 [Aspergillus melleus]|uniref:Uncharacterized protein n=1 Tax=Aspergillus melleus TaxID=138277 RepID=A0ACC3AZV4_9EURO|nr:hypothetical protein N8T08_007031 [Aspergillus melleus]
MTREKSAPKARRQRSQERVRVYEEFDKESLNDMRRLVHGRVQQRNDAFTQRLSSLPQDNPEPTRASIENINEEFSQLEKNNPDQINKLQDLLTVRRAGADFSQSMTDEVDELNTYEAGVGSLATLIDNASTSGFLKPGKGPLFSINRRSRGKQEAVLGGQRARKGRTDYSHLPWRKEAAVFRDKEYPYTVCLGSSKRTVNPYYCSIAFPPDMDIGDGSVWVKIEICPLGQRHPEVYAKFATNEDPASRLAFRVRYKVSEGTEHQFYGDTTSSTLVYRANTLVDILANNIPDEIIAKTPRRYLYFRKESCPPGLERFGGGNYTEF